MGGLVDVEVAALAAGVTPRAIRARITAGHLPAVRHSGRWYVHLDHIETSNTTARDAQRTRHTRTAA